MGRTMATSIGILLALLTLAAGIGGLVLWQLVRRLLR